MKSSIYIIMAISIICFIISLISNSAIASEGSQTVIYVDGNQVTDGSQNRYKTITEALAAVPLVHSEDERVIIEIADGIYQEQVIVNKPYITFRGASADASKVTITWYYGIGYVYNNIGTNGFYDPNVNWSDDATWRGLRKHKIGDRISKVTYYDKNGVLHKNESVNGGVLGKPDRWGCTVKLNRSADNFTAESITFENSFDFYVTQEEIDADVTPEPQSVPKPDRASLGAGSTEVEKQKYIERAAALHTDSDRTIIRNSIIKSKQDTLYIGSGRILFDKSTIVGGTDYIFGGATAVFNECNLVFAGVENNSNTGVITAGSHSPTTQYGYLFWNSTIDYRLKDKAPRAGHFGRPWSNPLGAQITFYGTTITKINDRLLISDEGWRDMKAKRDEARFYEYGSIDKTGNSINTFDRVVNSLNPLGTVLDEWQILEFNPRNYLKGNDGWDPLNFAQNYKGIDKVLSTTKIEASSIGNIVSLPVAPEGYDFLWVSDSEYAVVNNDISTISIIRPAYGESAIDATVTLYVKDLATGYGDKKSVPFKIQARTTKRDTFSVAGTVSLNAAAKNDIKVKIVFSQKGIVLKTEDITIPAGKKSINYKAEYLPVGNYDVLIKTTTDGYKVTTGERAMISAATDERAIVSATTGETKVLDVKISKLVTRILKITDFSETWSTAAVTESAEGFTMDKYISTGLESANLGTNNVVYKFTKEDGTYISSAVGGSWDLLAAVKKNGGTLENTDIIQFSFDFLMETVDYMPGDYSYFDLTTSRDNGGRDSRDNTRFVRWGVHHGWTQFNMFGADNARVNGDNTQFNKNDKMANKWYHIVADIDLKNKIITTTLYNRDANRILNRKAFRIAAPDVNGNNMAYPEAADITDGLYFNVYMDYRHTLHKMEYYFDNLELKYQDYSNGK